LWGSYHYQRNALKSKKDGKEEEGKDDGARKSSGKIVKNSHPKKEVLSRASISTSKIAPVESALTQKHQKVFIRLETENLSKYLFEGSIQK
jgi:hypothetical protein